VAGTGELITVPEVPEIRAARRVFFSRRLWLAVAFSLLAHWLIMSVPLTPEAKAPGLPPLKVRIATFNATRGEPVNQRPVNPRSIMTSPSSDSATLPLPKEDDVAAVPQDPGGGEDDFYFPRSELTRAPEVSEDTDLQELATLPGAKVGSVVVELFIDEHGTIARINPEASELDPAFVERLKAALSVLTFSSGEIDGFPVKSRIRIEIGFLPVLDRDGRRRNWEDRGS
jgi:hypothetical protein